MEEFRQQVALSQGMKAKLEVQRLLLKEKLDQLGYNEPFSALKLDADTVSLPDNTSNVCNLWRSEQVVDVMLDINSLNRSVFPHLNLNLNLFMSLIVIVTAER